MRDKDRFIGITPERERGVRKTARTQRPLGGEGRKHLTIVSEYVGRR
jgi:hypothetical protein